MNFNCVNVDFIITAFVNLKLLNFIAPFGKLHITHRVLRTLNRGHLHLHNTQLDFITFDYSYLWFPTSFLPFHL